MRIVAGVVGFWCLIAALALVVVDALPTEAVVIHVHRIEGEVGFELEVEVDSSGRIDIVPRPVVIQGLPDGLGL